jgi:hypothetical protein
MPSTADYAEKKIAEYLAGVAASLSHLPEAERSRRLRNAESEIRSQLRERNPATPTQWDVDLVLASFPPPSRHAKSGTASPAKHVAPDRQTSPLITVAGVVLVLAGIAILVLFLLTGIWNAQPNDEAQQEQQQTPPSNETANKEVNASNTAQDNPERHLAAAADTQPSQQPRLPAVFSLAPAAIRVVDGGSIRRLQKGCLLYSDKDVTMKEYPKKIAFTAMNYIKAPFSGCSTICTTDGALLAIGIYDVHQQEQTDRIRDYLVKNEWIRVEESPRFVLFYTNGADRMGELYWKKVAKGDELDFPPGMLLCFVPLTARLWSEQWRIVENEQGQNLDLANHHPMGWIDVDLPPDTYCNRPVWEGGGKHNGILAIHPLSTVKPARLSYIGKVNPATPILSVNACGNAGAGGDFLLQCVVNNNKIGEFVVDATRWRLYEFDLSASLASSPDPVIEIWGAAGGEKLWSFEHGYIDAIQFKASAATAPAKH